jgi:predicted NBD/HSP70 family sugar kinase
MFNHAAAIGADIGSNLFRIAVVNMDGEIISVKSYPLNQGKSRNYPISKNLEAIRDIRQTIITGINMVQSSFMIFNLDGK